MAMTENSEIMQGLVKIREMIAAQKQQAIDLWERESSKAAAAFRIDPNHCERLEESRVVGRFTAMVNK